MKSSLYSLITFSPFLLNHLRLPSQGAPSILSPIITLRLTFSQSVLVSSPDWDSFNTVWKLRSYYWEARVSHLPEFFIIQLRGGPHRKHSSPIVAWIRLLGNVFVELFHSNGCTHDISYRDNSSIVACEHYLSTAVFLAPQFFLSANTPQYVQNTLVSETSERNISIRLIEITVNGSIATSLLVAFIYNSLGITERYASLYACMVQKIR
jgi:hypothetical protein